jgi:hypothetical protein
LSLASVVVVGEEGATSISGVADEERDDDEDNGDEVEAEEEEAEAEDGESATPDDEVEAEEAEAEDGEPATPGNWMLSKKPPTPRPTLLLVLSPVVVAAAAAAAGGEFSLLSSVFTTCFRFAIIWPSCELMPWRKGTPFSPSTSSFFPGGTLSVAIGSSIVLATLIAGSAKEASPLGTERKVCNDSELENEDDEDEDDDDRTAALSGG